MAFKRNYDIRYLNESENLADLDNVTTARTNLGLVAGGAGDIWVEKAGDMMTGNLNLGGNSLIGSTAVGGDLNLSSTSNATKGSIFLGQSLEVEADGSGPGATSLSILKFANGDRIYAQTVVDRMFYTSDRFEVLSKDGVESIASFNSSASANADSILFYKGVASGNYAGSAIPSNGFAFVGDCGIGTLPDTQFHVKMVSNTDVTIEGNNNFASEIWKKANGTIMGYFGYSNAGGYINNSQAGAMHFRGQSGITFGYTAVKSFDVLSSGYVYFGPSSATAKARVTIEAGSATIAPFALNSGTVLTTPQAGAFEFDGMGVYFTPNDERRSIQLADGSITSTVTVANTTTETTIYSEPISAGSLDVGEVIDILLNGFYSTANAADTFTLRFKIGATTVLTVTSTAKNVTNTPFEIDFRTTIRTIGAGGTCISYASVKLDNTDASAAATTTTAINTTNANTLTVTLQWSNALAANTLSLTQGITHFAYNA